MMKVNFLHNNINGIYAITPNHILDINAVEKVVIEQNISILQYRHKISDTKIQLNEALQLQILCKKHHILFIINDDIDLAKNSNADGVHLGKNDRSIQQARQQLGDNAIIGVSCYNDIDLAKNAQTQGADYVAFGALFPSSTKPNAPKCPLNTLTQAKKIINIPIIGIGGINFNNQQQALDAGCDGIAMITALWE